MLKQFLRQIVEFCFYDYSGPFAQEFFMVPKNSKISWVEDRTSSSDEASGEFWQNDCYTFQENNLAIGVSLKTVEDVKFINRSLRILKASGNLRKECIFGNLNSETLFRILFEPI
jgi:hypothetical protein